MCQVEDKVALCWHRFSAAVVRLCEIEETSRICGVNRTSDSEAGSFGDRYSVRAVDHHRMRRRQGDAGLLQFHCGKEK